MTVRWDDPRSIHSLEWLTNGDVLKDIEEFRTRAAQYGDHSRWGKKNGLLSTGHVIDDLLETRDRLRKYGDGFYLKMPETAELEKIKYVQDVRSLEPFAVKPMGNDRSDALSRGVDYEGFHDLLDKHFMNGLYGEIKMKKDCYTCLHAGAEGMLCDETCDHMACNQFNNRPWIKPAGSLDLWEPAAGTSIGDLV